MQRRAARGGGERLTTTMALFVWVAVATALWHFTIFVPDRFPGGMVGAFACANAGALIAGIASNGLSMPPLTDVSHADAVTGAVGGLLGLAVAYRHGRRSPRNGDRSGRRSPSRRS